MLELLTLLPEECEDAAAAAVSAPAEVAWGLKARSREWSAEVAAWLYALHRAGCGGNGHGSGGGGGGGGCNPDFGFDPAAAQQQQQSALTLTLGTLRCFGAWVKWGCLPYIDPLHAAHFATLAGQLLFVPGHHHDAGAAAAAAPSNSGGGGGPPLLLPFSPDCLPAGVDATSEVIEHATEALEPLLLRLALQLPQRVAALHAAAAAAGGAMPEAAAAAGEVAHVFALYCSTHCELCVAEGPDGQALRQVSGGSRAWVRSGVVFWSLLACPASSGCALCICLLSIPPLAAVAAFASTDSDAGHATAAGPARIG